jgi:hypothetical protein
MCDEGVSQSSAHYYDYIIEHPIGNARTSTAFPQSEHHNSFYVKRNVAYNESQQSLIANNQSSTRDDDSDYVISSC